MESAEFSRLKNEWLYGVELFLDSDNGREIVDSLGSDVEKQVFLMLLESMLPTNGQTINTELLMLHRWKTSQHHEAWVFYQEHLLRTNIELSSHELARGFAELEQKAASQKEQVKKAIDLHSVSEDSGQRDTPVMDVSGYNKKEEAPVERVTIPCAASPEAMKKLDRCIQRSAVGGFSGLVLDDFSNFDRRSILPPPPAVESVHFNNKDSANAAPEIEITFDESGLDED